MQSEQYLIRPYEPADRDGFLDLYESVWDHAKGREWFDWRFRSNPYGDGVRMVVAECDGELVGAEPLLPFPLRIGSRRVAAYQPVDWIVHPDHRRRGVFTRMTERLLTRYGDDAELLFNFPNDALLPGLKQFDWREIETLSTSYRVQDPCPFLTASIGPATTSALGPFLTVAKTITRQGLSVLDRVNAPSARATVERYAGVATAPLERLYASAPPERIHVPREAAFLEWRFGNPRWETTTYVASVDDTPVATLVAATEHRDDCTVTTLLDGQPIAGTTPASDAVESLFVELLRDSRGADVVKVPGWFDPHLRHRYGFWTDTAIPLSERPHASNAVVRPLGPGRNLDSPEPWHIDGRDLTAGENWLFTLADRDIE